MARDITAGMVTEVQSAVVTLAFLVKLEFPAFGDVNLWTGVRPVIFDGDTYSGVGDLLGVSDIVEEGSLKASSVTFTLSGIPAANLSLALTENVQDRPARAWLAMFNSSDNIIADPIPIFVGRMSTMDIVEKADTSSISIVAENILTLLNRASNRRWTDEDQQIEFPNDTFFKFVVRTQDQDLVWT